MPLIVVVSTTTVGACVVVVASVADDDEVSSVVGVGEEDDCSVVEDVGVVSGVLDGVEKGDSLLLIGVLLVDEVEIVLGVLDVKGVLDFEVVDVFVGVDVDETPVPSCTLTPPVIAPRRPLLSSCRPKMLTESNQLACAMAKNARIDSSRR